MEIFYPGDTLGVIRQMMAFFCWAFAVQLGWRFADHIIQSLKSLFSRNWKS